MNTRCKSEQIKQNILSSIRKNKKEYISLCIFLFIGVVLGVLCINKAKDEEQLQIQNYITNFIELTKNNGINKLELLKELTIKNILTGILLWFVSSTIIGIPLTYLYTMYNGFCISYTIASSIAVLGKGKGIIFAIFSMLLQNIIIIPTILSISVSGINLYKSITRDRRKENIKIEIVKHTIISAIATLGLIIGALIESYITTSTLELLLKYI